MLTHSRTYHRPLRILCQFSLQYESKQQLMVFRAKALPVLVPQTYPTPHSF
jgi:hypothetical protein